MIIGCVCWSVVYEDASTPIDRLTAQRRRGRTIHAFQAPDVAFALLVRAHRESNPIRVYFWIVNGVLDIL